MKTFRTLLSALCLAASMPLMAQNVNHVHDVATTDRHAMHAYREGEVIVKFKPTSRVNVSAARTGAVRSNVSSVDVVLAKIGVTGAEQLMPLSGSGGPARVKSYAGGYIERSDMSKLYRLQLDTESGVAVNEAVEALSELGDVEFAEPNYLVYTTALPEEVASEHEKEPLYCEQWYIQAVKLNNLWTKEKITDKRPVIAILDTGVDTEHPDLAANIWTNEREAKGAEDADDDANGYKDDIHGWDFVDKTARIGDWNGHGTHVAGIAAAVGNNGVGITGANPDALIMPITVMQSDGTGDVATIIKGIDYAAANGADVINMSFGGYAYSIAEEQALARAYNTAVLVASAGNDCLPINYKQCPVCKKPGSPMFPAAFTIVLGVEAGDRDGSRASFSNYDNDGPTFSAFGEEKLYNYELRAPGVAMTSTLPGGKYKALNGTSMASPLVAGAISRLLQCKEYNSKELLFGDLIHARKKNDKGIVDFQAAYEIKDEDRMPELQFVSYELVDNDGDSDGCADAGETIELWPVFRNEWGNAENITFSLEVAEAEDPTIIEILDNNVIFGKPLSGYAKAKSENPLRIKINEKCNDQRNVRLVLRATCDNIAEELVHEFFITVENGVEIGGMITEDMTLYPNVHYIVKQSLAIPEGITLTIKPGTVLRFKNNAGLMCKGYLECKGTPDSLIVFTSATFSEMYTSSINLHDYMSDNYSSNTLEYVLFQDFICSDYFLKYGNIKNCILRNIITRQGLQSRIHAEKCNIFNNQFSCVEGGASSKASYRYHNNVIGNFFDLFSAMSKVYLYRNTNIFANFLIDSRKECNIDYTPDGVEILKYEDGACYWGSQREEFVREGIHDMYHPTNPAGFGVVDLSNMLTRPSVEAHGIVWKVVVNGYDAQDEFELLPPLGVGKHKFEVYFNRPMDVDVAPTVAMGVRPPYTQVTIAEDGEWSSDSLIYTAYLTIDGKTGCDGLNRIYVAGARDNEYFDIPVEEYRFNVEVAAAGSMATGLMAEVGLGKVTLTWETDEEDFEDLLGYNIYRYTNYLDSTYVVDYNKYGDYSKHLEVKGDTTIINKSVIESNETEFVDYDVVPGTTYYYVIKQLTTSLNSHALSNAVAATPLTAQKGDANGSMAVDIADVVTEVAWLTNQNPQPFIFEAADVNSDNNVNILDVVGTVTIITNPESVATASVNSTATYTIEDGILYIDSDVAVGGIQLSISAPKGTKFEALEALNGFEQMNHWMNDDECMFLAFSMTGKSIAPGKQAILRIGDATLNDVIISNSRGANVMAVNGNATCVSEVVGEDVEEEGIYDLAGRKLKQISSPGVYIVNGKKTFVK